MSYLKNIRKYKTFYPPDLSNKQEVRYMDVWKAVCAFVALLRKERKELPDDPERKKNYLTGSSMTGSPDK